MTFDLWALHRGLEPQQAVVRQAASFGVRRSAHRPLGLNDDEAKALKDDPVYQHYVRLLETLQPGTAEWKDCKREQKTALERLRYAATKKSIGKDWTRRQAIENISQQLSDSPSAAMEATRSRQPQPMSPAQQRMVDALNQPMKTTLEGQLERRMAAIQAMIEYSKVKERYFTKVEKPIATGTGTSTSLSSPALSRDDETAQLRKSVYVTFQGQRLKRCYICVAQSLDLPADDPNIPELCREYAAPSSLKRHFESSHLRFMDAAQLPSCPLCVPQFKFKHFRFLQNHALTVHGIVQTKVWKGEQRGQKKA